jgi:hypothetical protein
MKVKCTANELRDADLVYGKVYDVISIEWDWYRIIDESEEDYMYPPEAFEIVEALPKPPVLTEEEIAQGHGNKYMVTDPYGDYLRSRGLSREDDFEEREAELELAVH